jgi:hypothetical protein
MRRTLAFALRVVAGARAELTVTSLGPQFKPGPARVVVAQPLGDRGGNTSLRNTGADAPEWKAAGYYQRNRDLLFFSEAGAQNHSAMNRPHFRHSAALAVPCCPFAGPINL